MPFLQKLALFYTANRPQTIQVHFNRFGPGLLLRVWCREGLSVAHGMWLVYVEAVFISTPTRRFIIVVTNTAELYLHRQAVSVVLNTEFDSL